MTSCLQFAHSGQTGDGMEVRAEELTGEGQYRGLVSTIASFDPKASTPLGHFRETKGTHTIDISPGA